MAAGHHYLTLVYQIDEGCKRLLYIGADRTAASLRGFFDMAGAEVAAGLKYVCSDMWRPYLDVLAELVPQGDSCAGPISLGGASAQGAGRNPRGGGQASEGGRFTNRAEALALGLLKRRENLTNKQTLKLQEILKYNLRTVRAYLHLEDLQTAVGVTSRRIGRGSFSGSGSAA